MMGCRGLLGKKAKPCITEPQLEQIFARIAALENLILLQQRSIDLMGEGMAEHGKLLVRLGEAEIQRSQDNLSDNFSEVFARGSN